MRTISEAATELRTVKDRKKALEKEVKKLGALIYQLSVVEIPALLEAQGGEAMKVPGVGTVYTVSNVFAHVRKEDEEQFHAWLRENGQEDLIKSTVHPGTLKGWAKERLEKGLPLPEFVQASFQDQALIRKT